MELPLGASLASATPYQPQHWMQLAEGEGLVAVRTRIHCGASRELRNGQSILQVAVECQQSVSAGSTSIPSVQLGGVNSRKEIGGKDSKSFQHTCHTST